MQGYTELQSLVPEIEVIIKDKPQITVSEVGLELGIHPKKMGHHAKRFISDVMKKNGFSWISCRENGKIVKRWRNKRYVMSMEYLMSAPGEAPHELGLDEARQLINQRLGVSYASPSLDVRGTDENVDEEDVVQDDDDVRQPDDDEIQDDDDVEIIQEPGYEDDETDPDQQQQDESQENETQENETQEQEDEIELTDDLELTDDTGQDETQDGPDTEPENEITDDTII